MNNTNYFWSDLQILGLFILSVHCGSGSVILHYSSTTWKCSPPCTIYFLSTQAFQIEQHQAASRPPSVLQGRRTWPSAGDSKRPTQGACWDECATCLCSLPNFPLSPVKPRSHEMVLCFWDTLTRPHRNQGESPCTIFITDWGGMGVCSQLPLF